MRVLYGITRADTLGGAHIHVAEMAAWMLEAGHEAIVIVGGEGPYLDYLTAKGVPCRISKYLCRPVHPWRDFRAVLELRRIFRECEADMVSLHSSKAGFLGRLAAASLNVPVLFTAHGWAFTEGVSASSARLFRLMEQLVAPLASRIIAVSEFDRSLALAAKIGDEAKVQTIVNGMRDGDAMASPGVHRRPAKIAMVARMDEQKDHETLFQALACLSERQWVLSLVGDGPHVERLKALANRMGLADRVRFLGLRRDVDQILAESHIFVLISRWEGLPRSILEAMRAGLPVIASAVGGVPESVKDGETGFLVPRAGVELLRTRLAYLLDQPQERARLGRAGRKHFEDRFLFARMAADTFTVYREVIRERACVSA